MNRRSPFWASADSGWLPAAVLKWMGFKNLWEKFALLKDENVSAQPLLHVFLNLPSTILFHSPAGLNLSKGSKWWKYFFFSLQTVLLHSNFKWQLGFKDCSECFLYTTDQHHGKLHCRWDFWPLAHWIYQFEEKNAFFCTFLFQLPILCVLQLTTRW